MQLNENTSLVGQILDFDHTWRVPAVYLDCINRVPVPYHTAKTVTFFDWCCSTWCAQPTRVHSCKPPVTPVLWLVFIALWIQYATPASVSIVNQSAPLAEMSSTVFILYYDSEEGAQLTSQIQT